MLKKSKKPQYNVENGWNKASLINSVKRGNIKMITAVLLYIRAAKNIFLSWNLGNRAKILYGKSIVKASPFTFCR